MSATTRKPEPHVMHSRPNPGQGAEFQGWHIHPVREYTDHHGGTFFETCDDEQALDEGHPDAVGPVLFGVYLHAHCGKRAGEWMNVMDFKTYEEAMEFLDAITGPVTEVTNGR